MLRNNVLLLLGAISLIVVITTAGQKVTEVKAKPWEHVNIDSLVQVTAAKNEKTIHKRIGEFKHAQKAADSLSKVVSILKTENKLLYEKVSNSAPIKSDDTYELLPISEGKDH